MIFKKFFLPVLSVWLIVYYFRILNFLHHNNIINAVVCLLLFFPVILYEFVIGNLFSCKKVLSIPEKLTEKISLASRITFWFILFFVWVIDLPLDPNSKKWLEFFNFSLVPMFGMVYIAEGYLSLVALSLWLILYYVLTVRKQVLRIFTSFIIPVLLSIILFHHFYFIGGLGRTSVKEILKQKGVELVYDTENFPKIDYFDYKWWLEEVRFFPRELYLDKKRNTIYTNYASTYGNSSGEKTPAIISIDLTNKKIRYFVSYYTRAMYSTDNSILICPWFDEEIYELDKENLSLIRKIPAGIDIFPWEIIEIYCDANKRNIYITNDMTPILLKYDYKTGKLIDKWQPDEYSYGGTLWCFQVSRKSGYIYLIGFGTDGNIYEIDPENFKVLRKLNFSPDYKVYIGLFFENPLFFIPGLKKYIRKTINLYGGSALAIDDSNDLLYFQDGGSNRLYEIDIKNFKIKRILKSGAHSRKIYIDKKRNLLYLLSFFYGKLIAIDLNTGKHLWMIKVGAKPYGLVVDDNFIYVNSMAGIFKINSAQTNFALQ